MSDNKYAKKGEKGWEITAAGEAKLKSVLTNHTGNVYAFNGNESPVLIAAAMARLSRRGDDMRITYLDEFAGAAADADNLIHRVVTAYGDDSVQQLVGVHLVVENASNILTKLLEWGRLGAYLEQSTRYIFFDTKVDGKYRYYTPTNLGQHEKQYNQSMDALFELYSSMVRALTEYVREKYPEPADKKERTAWLGATRAQACDAIRPVLPVATTATVGIFVSGQALDSLIMHLLSEPLEEARAVGRQILTEARKVVPAFLERTDLPERGGATVAYRATTRAAVRTLASKITSKRTDGTHVELSNFWPHNEYDLVPEILFESATASLADITNEVATWSDADKQAVLDASVGERLNRRHKPGRAWEIPHYEFEITGDYGTFRDLQRHRIVDALEWQDLTTELGYDIPELVKEAGLAEDFTACFDLSQALYALLCENHPNEAQYATLLGHRMRYRIMLNARAAFHFLELRTTPQGHPGYRKICKDMYDKITDVHPKIATAMKFINKDEDPELTRLAAERATQYKLEQMEKKH
jgi:thymidylate synthase ThyX